MKLVSTTYASDNFSITVDEEVQDHISVHEYGEPCSGVLKHWGSKAELIEELEEIIGAIKKL